MLAFSENPLSVLPALQRIGGWFGPLKRFNELSARADRLIFELIEDRRRAGNGDHDDVLGMLLEARHEDGSSMSAQELRDELMTALVAGHETTASQLAWGFERLAREPRVIDRLLHEGDEYLTATVYEILRLRPVLPNAEPRLTKRPVKIGEIEYPPGVALLASAYLIHHDPEIYPEPRAFRPERFLGNAQPDDPGVAQSGEAGRRAGGKPGTYTWIPFGGGRRRCLGASFALQEMKIVIRAVVSRFELAPASSRAEQTARRSITFSPSGGASVILHGRSRSEVPEPALVPAA